MNTHNARINEIMKMDEEDLTNELIEEYVELLKNAKFLIPTEVPEGIDIESLKEDEILNFDEDSEFEIVKLEDEEGNEFVPVFTDDEAVDDLEVPGYGLIMEAEDLANWLFDTEIDNENMLSILINPFTDFPAEMGFLNYLELFDLVELEECDDPDCDDPHHHHHHEHHDHEH